MATEFGREKNQIKFDTSSFYAAATAAEDQWRLHDFIKGANAFPYFPSPPHTPFP